MTGWGDLGPCERDRCDGRVYATGFCGTCGRPAGDRSARPTLAVVTTPAGTGSVGTTPIGTTPIGTTDLSSVDPSRTSATTTGPATTVEHDVPDAPTSPVSDDRDATTGPAAPDAAAAHRRSPRAGFRELHALRRIPPPDPPVLLPTPHVEPALRRCVGCGSAVGQPTPEHPEGREEGYCPQPTCLRPYSFVPRLHEGDLLDGHYRVQGVLARGGYGWVYLARDERLDTRVAIKELVNSADRAALRLTASTRRRLIDLDDSGVVKVLTVAADPHDPGITYVVLGYVPGYTLHEVARAARGPGGTGLSLIEVGRYGMCLLDALEYLHDRDILYFDLKPENVIHSDDQITLVDLGALRSADDQESPYFGTVGYRVSAAELRRHGATVRSDLYSLGRVLQTLAAAADETDEPSDTVTGLAEEFFRATLARAAADDYDDRFVDAAEMRHQLGGAVRDLLAASDGAERPVPSSVFAESPGGLDGGLGHPPTLAVLRDNELDSPLSSGPARPDPRPAAAILPAPHAAPEDPASSFVEQLRAPDRRRLEAKLSDVADPTPEVLLARVRVGVEMGRTAPVAVALDRAARSVPPPAGWRLGWHEALVTLSREDLGQAEQLFLAVGREWPGEPAPKFGVGLCLELGGRPREAEPWYALVQGRDHGHADAAFGLARVHLARDRREAAIRVLEQVPLTSRHYDTARVAVVRLRMATSPTDGRWPSPHDVSDAVTAVLSLNLDTESYDRVVAPVWAMAHGAMLLGVEEYWEAARPLLEAAEDAAPGRRGLGRLLDRFLAEDASEQEPTVILERPAPEAAALALARALHRLARQAGSAEERFAFLDRAHDVRPGTWV